MTPVEGTPLGEAEERGEVDELSPVELAAELRDMQDNTFDNAMLVGAAGALIGTGLALWLLRGPVPPLHSAAVKTEAEDS